MDAQDESYPKPDLNAADEVSFVHLGANNIFLGPVGDIAGRDIYKQTIHQHFYEPLDLEKRRRLEQECLRITASRYHQAWEHAIDLDLKIDSAIMEAIWASQLVPFMGDEFHLLFESQSELANNQTTVTSLFDLFARSNTWLLTGEPGCGKTTLLYKLAYDQAQISLDSQGALHTPLAASRPKSKEHLPVLLDLSAYDYDGTTPILELLQVSWIGDSLGLELKDYLEMRTALILIDGIDVVPNTLQSQAVHEVRELVAQFPGNQCIVATRRYSLNNDLGFPKCTVEPLSPTQSRLLLERYLGTSATALYQYFEKQLDELLWLTHNPYTLLMLASVPPTAKEIPANLADLLYRFTRRLFARELKRKENRRYMEELVREKLARFAYDMTRSGKNILEVDTQSEVADAGYQGISNQQVIELGKNTGILRTSPEGDQVQFAHSILQAYYAALEIKKLREQDKRPLPDSLSLEALTPADVTFPRTQLFTRPQMGENPWDCPMPLLQRNRWYQSMRMLAWMAQDREALFEEMLGVNPILVADLLASDDFQSQRNLLERVRNSLLSILSNRGEPKRVRLTAAYWLGLLGDPRIVQHDMVFIPGVHDFAMGAIDQGSNGSDRNKVAIEDFYVDKYLVTNAQFKKFIEDGGYSRRELWSKAGWEWIKSLGRTWPTYWEDEHFNLPNAPVVGVSWYEAASYSHWRGMRLLTEAEWEYLATYNPATAQKQVYPWGDQFHEDAANLMKGEYTFRTTPVGMYPAGANAWGVYDLAGNVWEWLSSLYLPYPFNPSRTEDEGQEGWRCLRGGSWSFDSKPGASGTVRFSGDPKSVEHFNRGFRCARSASP